MLTHSLAYIISHSLTYFLTNSFIISFADLLTPVFRGLLHQMDYNFAILPSAIPREQPALTFKSPGVKSAVNAKYNPDIFKVAIRKDIVHEVIRYQRAKIRQPKVLTHSPTYLLT